MKKIIMILILLITIAIGTTTVYAKKDKPIQGTEQKQSRKQVNINSAYETLKSQVFNIREYSKSMRDMFFKDGLIVYCDKNNFRNTKILVEKFDSSTKTYNLAFSQIKSGPYRGCIYKLSFNIESGVLEIRYFFSDDGNMSQQDIEQKRGKRLFTGDYTNVRSDSEELRW